MNSLIFKTKSFSSWNNTYKSNGKIIYPKNIKEIKYIFKYLKKKKLHYLIKTGQCSYDNKSININNETIIISLKNFTKIHKIKDGKISLESGALIPDALKVVKKNNYSLYSIPGGQKISIGGAISANAIGKDSSNLYASFGDSVKELKILSTNGQTYNIKKNINNFIGAFGLNGLIIQAKLKLKKITSPNLVVKSKILKNVNEILNFLNQNNEYRYVQIDPFFRKRNFAIAFQGNTSDKKFKLYKKINLNYNFFEKFIFKFLSNFINYYSWKAFYYLFFYFNQNKTKLVDLHNFHYESKYKHLIPLLTKKGMVEFEIMITKKPNKIIKNLINFIKKNNLISLYIVVKKTFRSKQKYNYSFNQNGYSLSFSVDKKYFNNVKLNNFLNLLKKYNIKVNYSKTDIFNLKKYNKKNYLFMSEYKKNIEKNEIPWKRT